MTYALQGSIRFMRDRAAEARAELATCTDPDMQRYLTARINQAECEAGAMQRSVDAWSTKLEEVVSRLENTWRIT